MSFESPLKAEKNLEVTEAYESDSASEKEHYHVFQDPKLREYYLDVYEKTNYECRHHIDPELTWTAEEEKKITRLNDWHVTLWSFIMFSALNFDRNNISNALSDGLLADIGLTTNDYNLANTVNLVCFLGAELPSQLISKKLGADVWIPTQMCLWSIVSFAQFWMNDKASFVACRGLIGLFEGGFICDMTLWMSYFFTRSEIPMRISLFYISNYSTPILSALLAAGILKIKTAEHPDGWRWLFLIEGVFTFVIGFASYFLMPASAVSTKTWYRKKGWYTERQEKILVNKIIREDPSKGDMNNRQPVGPKELIKGVFDIDMLPVYIIRLLVDIGCSPTTTYLTLTLRQLGFSTLKTNMLSIPYNAIGVLTMLVTCYFSERLQSRAYLLMLTPIWILACLFPLRYWPESQENVWGTYAILTVMLGHCPSWPLSISWVMHNSNSVRSRAVSSAVVNMFSQAAGIISANIYRTDDKPLYHRGNQQLIGIAFGAVASCVLAAEYYKWRNRQNKKKWESMSSEQQENYDLFTTDEGNKRVNFTFIY